MTLHSVMPDPEKVFAKVVVPIYGFFEKVGSIDFSARNLKLDQNFLFVKLFLNPII